jgi:ATP-dependent Lon protease
LKRRFEPDWRGPLDFWRIDARPGLVGATGKVLAAHAAGLTQVIVPERNQPDLDDVPSDVREQMQFHIVGSVDQVLALALEPTELAVAA